MHSPSTAILGLKAWAQIDLEEKCQKALTPQHLRYMWEYAAKQNNVTGRQVRAPSRLSLVANHCCFMAQDIAKTLADYHPLALFQMMGTPPYRCHALAYCSSTRRQRQIHSGHGQRAQTTKVHCLKLQKEFKVTFLPNFGVNCSIPNAVVLDKRWPSVLGCSSWFCWAAFLRFLRFCCRC